MNVISLSWIVIQVHLCTTSGVLKLVFCHAFSIQFLLFVLHNKDTVLKFQFEALGVGVGVIIF